MKTGRLVITAIALVLTSCTSFNGYLGAKFTYDEVLIADKSKFYLSSDEVNIEGETFKVWKSYRFLKRHYYFCDTFLIVYAPGQVQFVSEEEHDVYLVNQEKSR